MAESTGSPGVIASSCRSQAPDNQIEAIFEFKSVVKGKGVFEMSFLSNHLHCPWRLSSLLITNPSKYLRYVLILVALALAIDGRFAVGQTISLIHQFGTPQADFAHDITIDSGSVFLVGTTAGTFPGQSRTAGGWEAFVQKYDTSGREVWTRQFGASPWSTNAMGVAARNGAVYLVGGYNTLDSMDAYIRKYDTGGNVLWTRQFGSLDVGVAEAVAADVTGIYVAGYTRGWLPGQSSAGFVDAFLRKYDDNGNEIWTRQFGTPEWDRAISVCTDATGVYVVGETSGTLPGESPAGAYGTDAFIRKYDANGNVLWTRQFGTSSEYDGAAAVGAGAGSVYVAGYTGGAFAGQTAAGGLDAFLRKFDTDGNHVWTRQFGSSAYDRGEGLAVDATSVHLAGRTNGALPGQSGAGADDAFVRRYDANGNVLWTHQFGRAGTDVASAAASDSNTVFLAGWTEGALAGQTSAGSTDAFLVMLHSVVPDTTPPVLSVSLSPNVLWPPNHKLVEIAASINAEDDSGSTPTVRLLSVVSNEADGGLGDGDTSQDIQQAELGTDDRSFLLRAERSGHGQGRIYTVTYEATDAAGNSTTSSAQVVVPYSWR